MIKINRCVINYKDFRFFLSSLVLGELLLRPLEDPPILSNVCSRKIDGSN